MCVFTIRPRLRSAPEPGSTPHTVSVVAPSVILASRVSLTLTGALPQRTRPGSRRRHTSELAASRDNAAKTNPSCVAERAHRGKTIFRLGRYFGTMLNDTTCRRAAIGGSFAAPPGMAAQAKS